MDLIDVFDKINNNNGVTRYQTRGNRWLKQ